MPCACQHPCRSAKDKLRNTHFLRVEFLGCEAVINEMFYGYLYKFEKYQLLILLQHRAVLLIVIHRHHHPATSPSKNISVTEPGHSWRRNRSQKLTALPISRSPSPCFRRHWLDPRTKDTADPFVANRIFPQDVHAPYIADPTKPIRAERSRDFQTSHERSIMTYLKQPVVHINQPPSGWPYPAQGGTPQINIPIERQYS